MKKLISIFKRNKDNRVHDHKTSVSFSHLNTQEQNEILKRGARVFTEKFNKTFEKLARE